MKPPVLAPTSAQMRPSHVDREGFQRSGELVAAPADEARLCFDGDFGQSISTRVPGLSTCLPPTSTSPAMIKARAFSRLGASPFYHQNIEPLLFSHSLSI